MMERGVNNAGMSLKPIHIIRIEKQCHPGPVPDNIITSKTKAYIPFQCIWWKMTSNKVNEETDDRIVLVENRVKKRFNCFIRD